ncbi:hypothetical protein CSB93_6387 [Pseudomonas paraeruginosa]|uniref:Uncharacterized protein n=1 Tax=Pseudomonas paraeruginosa TaxID=2994495 RepID=A0A2R3IQ78_9PSED|nr:hypothetical protein CSB93_6387 [Pseudomonas paraeruginosa]AWE93327.1 hypothetical protein CSC28_5190 [Pseudomonas paraeruginosa]PTC34888.1 hypothetical protein CLJ1_4753 [Pseudomonas aeruginosa]
MRTRSRGLRRDCGIPLQASVSAGFGAERGWLYGYILSV